MRLYVTFLALLGLSVLATSCGDAAGKKLSSSKSKTVQLLESARTSINNFGVALENQAFVAASCGATGIPTAGLFSAQYNRDAFPCALKTDTKNLETLQGIMSLYSGIMCAIEDQVDFNYATSITTHSVTLDSIDACLNGISLGLSGTHPVTVQERVLAGGGSNWSYKITVDFTSGTYSGKRMSILLRENGNSKAVKVAIGTNGKTDFLGLFLDIDSATNVLRFDMYSELKHQRGVMTATDSTYSTIAMFYGAHSNGGGAGVLSYKSTGSSYEYQTTTGACTPSCGGALAPTTNFSAFGTPDLSTRLLSESDGVLTFTTALPAQFLP